jgi:hypothetical protein
MSSQRVRLRNLGVSNFDLVRKARQMFPEIQRRLDYAGGPISVDPSRARQACVATETEDERP